MHNAVMESNNAARGRLERNGGATLTAGERNVFPKMLNFCHSSAVIRTYRVIFNRIVLRLFNERSLFVASSDGQSN